MRIGKQDAPFQTISTSDTDTITVRGSDLCQDLIGQIDFTSYFWLLVTGARPEPQQAAMMNAVLVAIAEHGVVPSVAAARMTMAAAPEALQGAVAAGLLGCGSVVLGSAEAAGKVYSKCVSAIEQEGKGESEVVAEMLGDYRSRRQHVPGIGHPQHTAGDPRAHRLLDLSRELDIAGAHVSLLGQIADQAPAIFERALPVNVNGAIAAVMLDSGFPLPALKGIALLARTAGLIAHLCEEQDQPIGFILAHKAAEGIAYRPQRG